jgi:hypothetical protein
MSDSVSVRPVRGVRGIGLTAVIIGIVMILAGGTTWGMVASQLHDEHITVSSDAQFLGGHQVNGPLTAYAQAEVINKHALKMTGGKTYAQLAQDDPTRDTVMNASFLRASLFTSVVAFGVALLVVGCGVLFLLVGIALRPRRRSPRCLGTRRHQPRPLSRSRPSPSARSRSRPRPFPRSRSSRSRSSRRRPRLHCPWRTHRRPSTSSPSTSPPSTSRTPRTRPSRTWRDPSSPALSSPVWRGPSSPAPPTRTARRPDTGLA